MEPLTVTVLKTVSTLLVVAILALVLLPTAKAAEPAIEGERTPNVRTSFAAPLVSPATSASFPNVGRAPVVHA